jgi:hypothetical protein
MKQLITLVFLFSGILSFSASLSPEAKMHILTCTPGNELYSVYGHSALRITDPVLKIDWVYNYGVFDPNIENFYVRFAQGQLDYMLAKASFNGFMREYVAEGRGVSSQELLIDEQKRQELFDFLEWNALPENRSYRYHFFFDNCATRIRAVLDNVLGENLDWNLIENPHKPTFRDMIHAYEKELVWADFGIDIALGLPCDDKMGLGEDMFLPDYLQLHLSTATLNNERITGAVKEILPERREVPQMPFITPTKIAWLWFVLVAAFAIRSVRSTKNVLVLERITLVILGLVGILVTFLWFFTNHSTTLDNFNIIWAFPLHLFAVFVGAKKWMSQYWMFWSVLLFLFLIGSWALPQTFHPAFFPVAAAGFVSCFRFATLTLHSGKAK